MQYPPLSQVYMECVYCKKTKEDVKECDTLLGVVCPFFKGDAAKKEPEVDISYADYMGLTPGDE